MTTKLEILVGYLAGRQGKAFESIRRELENPSSEASRWLEAVQRRSQALSQLGSLVPRNVISAAPMRNGTTTRWSASKRLLPLLSGVSVASLLILALGISWRAQERRFLSLETMLAEREAQWGARFEHLNTVLTRRAMVPQANTPASKQPIAPEAKPSSAVDGPTVLALARIEARLGEVGERLKEAQPSPNQSDPTVDELRRDVERLRKEVETGAESNRQQSHELNLVVQQVLQLLRRLAIRPWGPDPMQLPVPEPIPEHQRRPGQGQGLIPGTGQIPGQGLMPGQDHPRLDPGQGNLERGSQGYSGGYTGPRMQRPGGPG